MKNRIIYIGSQFLGHLPDDGETMKNSLMREVISQYVDKIIAIDLRKRPIRAFYLLKFLVSLVLFRKSKVVISASVYVANKMLKVCHCLGRKDGIIYWVVGGLFDKLVVSGDLDVNEYKDLDIIIVQSETLADNLRKAGLTNILTVPNSKHIPKIPIPIRKTNRVSRFVFMSRITPEKGVELIINAVKILKQEGLDFTVDFYGRLDNIYKDRFLSLIDGDSSLNYCGVLNMTTPEGYATLSSYDIMLFPSYHPGEGFPGIVLDSYISALPIIASDWHENTRVVIDGETGIITPTNNQNALTNAMRNAIEGKYDLIQMSKNAYNLKDKYDVNNIINKELMKKIGII